MKQELRLDDAITAVRDEEPPAGAAEAAAGRVWDRVAQAANLAAASVETIRGCADVQALLGEHRQATLSGPRALLVEDHLKECAACRAAFRGGPRLAILPWRATTAPAQRAPQSARRYAVAAAALLATGLAGLAVQRSFFAVPSGSRAAVQSVSGVLQRVAAEETPALQPGQEVGEAESVRTARGSRAHLKLRDGSIVEMGERAELSVSIRGNDTTIRLERGNIIIQAAKRKTGRLLVASNDCRVYVTGTVFSVNSGLKGSRVSVIEGHVRVVRGGEEKQLEPGDQWATGAGMGNVPVSQEIAWSRDIDQHLALLGEMKALRDKLATIRMPGLRYESRLLGLLPETTAVFASLPNYGQALSDAHGLFVERLQESAVLRDWWSQADPVRHGGPSLAAIIEKVRSFSDFLGDEVAFAALVESGAGRSPRPFLLAELRRPGLREFIESELRAKPEGDGPPVHIFDETTIGSDATRKAGVYVLLRPDLIVVSPDPAALRLLASRLAAAGALERTAFGRRIADAYRDGVGLLFAADLERIAAVAVHRPADAEKLHASGMDDLRHLIVQRKELLGRAHTEAIVAFAGPRRGIASWLAAPAPMGTLDFVSPNAQAAAAFLSKSPSLVFDDILALVNTDAATATRGLAALESKLDQLRLREDIAEALGGEFAVALDGPLLPTPSWKLVAEVSDAARLQRSLQVVIGKANDEAASARRPALSLEAEQVGAQTFHSLRSAELPFEIHYTFSDGYLVAGPSRALVMQALRTRETGASLSHSQSFLALFPAGRQDHVSGLVYQNLGGVLGSLSGLAGSAPLTEQQRSSLDALSRDAKPTLLVAYGEVDGIQAAGIGGGLDFDPATLTLPLLLERGLKGTPRRARP